MAQLQPMIEQESAAFPAVFDVDPPFAVENAADRRTKANARPSDGAHGCLGGGSSDRRRENQARAGGPLEAGFSPLRQPLGSSLSQRASPPTSHSIGLSASSGESNDPRVPAWAERALIGMTAASARVLATERLLIASSASLYPLADLFTMLRPVAVVRPVIGKRGRGETGSRPQGGGMGGRGVGGRRA